MATRIPLTESSRILEARRTALGLAEQLEFDETKAGQVAITITEACTNLLKHAGGGEILLRMAGDASGRPRLEVWALDKGPGIRNIGESLRDGQSTTATLGTGLGAITRLSDAFDLYSQPGKGTALLAQFWRRPPLSKPIDANQIPARPLFDIDGFSVAVEGEQLSGDGWSYHHTPTGITVFVADGLGHGPLAELAARDAIRAFEKHSSRATTELLDLVHQATRGTRGAAAAVARIDLEERLVRFAGIGNIAGTLIAGSETRHMVSMNGIIGHHVRAFQEFTYSWGNGSGPEDTLMMLHSDGLGTRWDFRNYPGLGRKPCGLIAGVLYRDLARGRDDATSVVVRACSGDRAGTA